MQGWWWGWWLVRKFSRKSNQVSTDIQFVSRIIFDCCLHQWLGDTMQKYHMLISFFSKNVFLFTAIFLFTMTMLTKGICLKKFKPLKFSIYCSFEGIDFLLPINSFSPTNKTLIKTWKWLVTTGYWQNNKEQRMKIQNSIVFIYGHWHCQSNFCFENKKYCFVCEWTKF